MVNLVREVEVESEAIIQIMNISKSFGDHRVLEGVSLDIIRGETLAIIGRSGTGKSTALRLITGLTNPDAGVIRVFGRDISRYGEEEMNDIRKRIGVVFQYAALFDSMNCFENVAFRLLRDLGLSRDQAWKIAVEKLEMVGLSERVLSLFPSELSGGMRKRVGLARAIAADPEIVLYDEPNSGLDPITSDAIDNLIVSLQKRLKVTSVVVTHDMESAGKVANRIAMLYDGKIIGCDTPEGIRKTENPYIKQFVTGSSSGPIPVP